MQIYGQVLNTGWATKLATLESVLLRCSWIKNLSTHSWKLKNSKKNCFITCPFGARGPCQNFFDFSKFPTLHRKTPCPTSVVSQLQKICIGGPFPLPTLHYTAYFVIVLEFWKTLCSRPAFKILKKVNKIKHWSLVSKQKENVQIRNEGNNLATEKIASVWSMVVL